MITTFSSNLVIKRVFSSVSPQILAIDTFLGTVILSDEAYIPEVRKYIKTSAFIVASYGYWPYK